MKNSLRRTAGQVVLGLGLFTLTTATELAATMEIVRLSPTMIVVQEGRGRTFALNSARGIVVIDTSATLARMRQAKEMIEAEFRRSDYACVINTHDHFEHIGGNGIFGSAIPIIAHDGFRDGRKEDDPRLQAACVKIEQDLGREEERLASLAGDSPEFRSTSAKVAELRTFVDTIRAGVVGPAITFSDRLTLDLGDRTVRLIYFGKGHSHSDILVHIPEEKVLLTGGACSLGKLPPPFQAWPGTMEVARWIAVLSEFVDSEAELKHIIPGHAPHLTHADLKFIRDYYRELWVGLNEARRNGLTLEEVKSRFALPARFAGWERLTTPSDEVVRQHTENLEKLWAFLGGTPATKP